MHIYFIRHGESESNYGELITGQQDVPLTEKGRSQATAAGKAMAENGPHINHIISSHLGRAKETAGLIADQIGFSRDNIQINDLVIERSFGDLEGKPKLEDPSVMTDEFIKGHGGEVDSEIRARAAAFLDSIRDLQGSVLVVSHTGFGRRLRAVIENIPTSESNNFNNAELTDLGEVSYAD